MRLTRIALLFALLLSLFVGLGVVRAAPAPPARPVDSPNTVSNAVPLRQTAPTLAPTTPALATPLAAATLDPNASQDPAQETAAIIIIWAVIILVTAITIFLIWWTRPNRHPLRGRG